MTDLSSQAGLGILRSLLVEALVVWRAKALERLAAAPTARPVRGGGERAKAWAASLVSLGVPAFVTDGEVMVEAVGNVPPPAETEKLRQAAREFVRTQTLAKREWLIERAQTAVDGLPHVTVQESGGQIAVYAEDERVAALTRYRVQMPRSGRTFSGDLCASNSDGWRQLERGVRSATTLLAISRRGGRGSQAPSVPPPAEGNSQTTRGPQDDSAFLAPPIDLRFDFPATLTSEARDRALTASSVLREKRSFAPAMPVEVSTEVGTLTFMPLIENQNPLELAFTFARGGAHFEGAIRLKAPNDPLALRVVSAEPDSIIGDAWAAALIVYSELACAEVSDHHEPDREPVVARARPPADSRSASRRGRRPPARRALPSHTARTYEARASAIEALRAAIRDLHAVSGHLRRLVPGRVASREALQAAESVGISVPAGFTWVRPHRRGKQVLVRIVWPGRVPLL
jgi:hypothetical protein